MSVKFDRMIILWWNKNTRSLVRDLYHHHHPAHSSVNWSNSMQIIIMPSFASHSHNKILDPYIQSCIAIQTDPALHVARLISRILPLEGLTTTPLAWVSAMGLSFVVVRPFMAVVHTLDFVWHLYVCLVDAAWL